jgi:adenine-specific DNA-methyltransferase
VVNTELDVVYEIMLKYGIDLTFSVEEYDFNGKKVYSIGFGALIISLDDDITKEIADDIIKLLILNFLQKWKENC